MAMWTTAAEADTDLSGTRRRSRGADGTATIVRSEVARTGRVRRSLPLTTEGGNGSATASAVADFPGIDDANLEAVDAARLLLTSLQQRDEAGLPTRIGFTSALYGEGVTFVSRTVAAVLAHDYRQRVCFVDLNWGIDDLTTGPAKGRKGRKARKARSEGGAPVVGLAEVMR